MNFQKIMLSEKKKPFPNGYMVYDSIYLTPLKP